MTRFTLHRHTTFPRIGGGDPFDVDTRTDEEAFPRLGGGDPRREGRRLIRPALFPA